jgi:hypothetical protein
LSPSTGTSFLTSRFGRSLGLLVLVATSGAAMADRGPTDDLVIQSDPADASVVVKPDGIYCKTPCKLKLGRLLNYEVLVEKEGYSPQSVSVRAGSDQFRAEKGLSPNPIKVTLVGNGALQPVEPAPVNPPLPLPEPRASLDNCIQPAAVDRETCLGRIKLQMPRNVIEAVLGPPDAASRDNTTLRYGDRYLKLDAAGRLITISDKPL